MEDGSVHCLRGARIAYGVGTNQVTFTDDQGELQTVHGKAVTIWR